MADKPKTARPEKAPARKAAPRKPRVTAAAKKAADREAALAEMRKGRVATAQAIEKPVLQPRRAAPEAKPATPAAAKKPRTARAVKGTKAPTTPTAPTAPKAPVVQAVDPGVRMTLAEVIDAQPEVNKAFSQRLLDAELAGKPLNSPVTDAQASRIIRLSRRAVGEATDTPLSKALGVKPGVPEVRSVKAKTAAAAAVDVDPFTPQQAAEIDNYFAQNPAGQVDTPSLKPPGAVASDAIPAKLQTPFRQWLQSGDTPGTVASNPAFKELQSRVFATAPAGATPAEMMAAGNAVGGNVFKGGWQNIAFDPFAPPEAVVEFHTPQFTAMTTNPPLPEDATAYRLAQQNIADAEAKAATNMGRAPITSFDDVATIYPESASRIVSELPDEVRPTVRRFPSAAPLVAQADEAAQVLGAMGPAVADMPVADVQAFNAARKAKALTGIRPTPTPTPTALPGFDPVPIPGTPSFAESMLRPGTLAEPQGRLFPGPQPPRSLPVAPAATPAPIPGQASFAETLTAPAATVPTPAATPVATGVGAGAGGPLGGGGFMPGFGGPGGTVPPTPPAVPSATPAPAAGGRFSGLMGGRVGQSVKGAIGPVLGGMAVGYAGNEIGNSLLEGQRDTSEFGRADVGQFVKGVGEAAPWAAAAPGLLAMLGASGPVGWGIAGLGAAGYGLYKALAGNDTPTDQYEKMVAHSTPEERAYLDTVWSSTKASGADESTALQAVAAELQKIAATTYQQAQGAQYRVTPNQVLLLQSMYMNDMNDLNNRAALANDQYVRMADEFARSPGVSPAMGALSRSNAAMTSDYLAKQAAAYRAKFQMAPFDQMLQSQMDQANAAQNAVTSGYQNQLTAGGGLGSLLATPSSSGLSDAFAGA